jgi:hypothetical protein
MFNLNSPYRFGTMQTKLGIVKLLKSFKLLPSDKTPITMKLKPGPGFMTPDDGLWLKLEKLS